MARQRLEPKRARHNDWNRRGQAQRLNRDQVQWPGANSQAQRLQPKPGATIGARGNIWYREAELRNVKQAPRPSCGQRPWATTLGDTDMCRVVQGVPLHPSRLCRPEHPPQPVGGPMSILLGTWLFGSASNEPGSRVSSGSYQ